MKTLKAVVLAQILQHRKQVSLAGTSSNTQPSNCRLQRLHTTQRSYWYIYLIHISSYV